MILKNAYPCQEWNKTYQPNLKLNLLAYRRKFTVMVKYLTETGAFIRNVHMWVMSYMNCVNIKVAMKVSYKSKEPERDQQQI
jgi:hypothetical protein